MRECTEMKSAELIEILTWYVRMSIQTGGCCQHAPEMMEELFCEFISLSRLQGEAERMFGKSPLGGDYCQALLHHARTHPPRFQHEDAEDTWAKEESAHENPPAS